MEQVTMYGKDGFSYLIKKLNNREKKFLILMTVKGWGDDHWLHYTPLSKTVFGQYVETYSFYTNIEAQECLKYIRDLIEPKRHEKRHKKRFI
jgi:hypothetical protein